MNLKTIKFALFVATAGAVAGRADQKSGTLDIYWIDCEGGAATLIVTPLGESALLDAGSAGGRDAARIVAAARQAGLARIDYFVLTNYRPDHFGGAAEVARQLSLDTIYQRAIPEADPEGRAAGVFREEIAPFQGIPARREALKPGIEIPFRAPPGGGKLSFRCLAVGQKFIDHAEIWAPANERAGEARTVPPGEADNSAVFVLQLNQFRFFAGSDLTWNLEARLVAPYNLAGAIDVYQTDQHGMGTSNNPALLNTVAPAVVVMNNGPTIGGEFGTFAAIRSSASHPVIYQLHRSLNTFGAVNAPDEFVANRTETALDDKCPANFIKMAVDPMGKTYTFSIPGNGQSRTYQTR